MSTTPECPRWRLISAHYLNIPTLPDGTRIEWEHKETARESGRTVRKLFPVPMLLDPKDPADFNQPGEIVVCHDVDGARMIRGDLIFIGDPTQEMEPLNAEARVITDSLREKWINPIDTLPANGGMNSEESAFMTKMMEAFAKASPAPAAPSDEVTDLKDRLAKLEALLASGKSSSTEARRL